MFLSSFEINISRLNGNLYFTLEQEMEESF